MKYLYMYYVRLEHRKNGLRTVWDISPDNAVKYSSRLRWRGWRVVEMGQIGFLQGSD